MLALYFHAHYGLDVEDLPFWKSLAEKQGGPLLELGCGTGRVLIPLAEAGYAAWGIDKDPEMLDFLQGNLSPNVLPAPHLLEADFSDFNLDRQFPLVIVPCNTWSTLDADTRRRALGCITRHLNSGGLLAVSVPNPQVLLDLPPNAKPEVEDEFEHPLSGDPVQVSSAWKRSKDRLTVTWHYDHLLPDGDVQRTSVEVTHELVAAERYLEEVRSAGLAIEATYGEFDGSPYTAETENFIFVAKKL
ncbi:MAG TPA: class I SAM-dependent methyltransferase [Anaerolineales bacterium]|nr:class I SAM-dependent methyltransferase [Anaerolineales bacterium]